MSPHTTPPKSARAVLFTVFIALVFMAGGLPSPSGELAPTAQAIGTGIIITADDYQTAVSEIFGVGGYAYVVLHDATKDTTEQRDLLKGVKVTSTSDAAGFVIDLLETGTETGLFYGGFGFTNAAASVAPASHPFVGQLGVDGASGTLTPGQIKVASGDTVTVAGGGAGSASNTFKWFPAVLGGFTATNAAGASITATTTNILGTSDSVIFNIADADLNRAAATAEVYTSLLFVRTDSEPDGKLLEIRETGINTGVFTGTAQFRINAVAGPGQQDTLFVREGDKIKATYRETRNAAGRAADQDIPAGGATWTFNQATGGAVLFDRAAYVGVTTVGNENGLDRAMITVVDADPNKGAAQDPLSVTVQAETLAGAIKGVAVTLPLHELPGSIVGSPTTFIGTLGFRAPASPSCAGTVDACLPVENGDVLRVKYADNPGPAGAPAPKEALSLWRNAVDGVVVLGPSSTTRVLSGTGTQINVQVSDVDANRNRNTRENLVVKAKSTTNPTGIDVTLTETTFDSGVFSGTFEFATAAATGKLQVADRDRVTVEYVDAVAANGKELTARANAGNYVFWRADHVATVTTDAVNYYRHDGTAAGNILTVASVYVTDHDQNDPTRRDEIEVSARTINPALTNGEVTIKLREVGIDSGVFHGFLRFKDQATAGFSDRLKIDAAARSNEFTIEYNDVIPGGTTRSPSSGTLRYWSAPQEADAIIRLEETRTLGTDLVHQAVNKHYLNSTRRAADPATLENSIQIVMYLDTTAATVTATLESTKCTKGSDIGSANQERLVELTDPDGDNRYTGTFKIRNFAINPCETTSSSAATSTWLSVEVDKTFTAKVTMPSSGRVVTTTQTSKLLGEETTRFVDAALTADVERTGGLNTPSYLLVEGWSHNRDSTRREILNETLVGRGSGAATNVALLETGPDTGKFSTSFGYSLSTVSTQAERDAAHQVRMVDVKSIKLSSTLATYNAQTPGYGMYDAVLANSPPSRDQVSWWPVTDATLSVSQRGVGTRGITIQLNDGDGLANRVFETQDGTGSKTKFTPTTTPYIESSEVVTVTRQQSASQTTAASVYTMTITATTTNGPAEEVADRNWDGVVDCADIELSGTSTSGGLTGGTPTALPAGAVRCFDVTVPAAGNPTIRYGFEDKHGHGTCTPATGLNPVTCTATLTWAYRASLATSNSCPGGSASNSFQITRDSTGFTFCAAPSSTQKVSLSYMKSNRQLVGRSHELPTSAVLETDKATATYDAGASNPATNVWVFTGTLNVETTAAANNGAVLIRGARTIVDVHYADAAQTFDGGPGSDVQGHFRTNQVTDTWRSGATSKIRVMEPDFSADAGTPVFGPAIPIQLEDADSDRTSSLDTISVTIRDGLNNDASFSLELRETGSSTGVFRGIVPVSDLAHSAGGAQPNVLDLGTSATKVIRISYSDPNGADGNSITVTKSSDWRPAGTAVVDIFTDSGFATAATTTSLVSGNLGRLYVRVTDSDANTRAGNLDSVKIRVRSDRDSTGEEFTLTETGVNSGEFKSSGIPFQRTLIGGDGAVYARDFALFADEVFVSYIDERDINGNRLLVESVRTGWNELFDGTVDLDLSFYLGTDPTDVAELANLMVTVADGDRNLDPRAVDQMDMSGFTYSLGPVIGGSIPAAKRASIVRLVETGANTGVFIGVASFTVSTAGGGTETLGAVPQRALIPAANTNVIRFEYTDTTPASGAASTVFTDTAQWFQRGYGVVGFDKTGYNDLAQKAVVRLYDADITTGVPTVTVVSGADSTGIGVTMAKKRTGVFEGSFEMDTASASGKLRVNSADTVTARYNDGSPAGLRTDSASVSVGDFTAPVTALVTSPATPNGENGWFISSPTITFSANEPISKTFYKVNGGATQQFASGFTVLEGENEIEFWSEDVFGNLESGKKATVRYDETAPTAVLTGVAAKSAPAGAIELSWTSVAAKTDPKEFGSYFIYKGTTATKVGNATGETFTATPATDGTHTYLVAVADAAGNVDPALAVSVTGISDRVAPRLLTASVSPEELFEEIDLDLTVTMVASVNSDDLPDVDKVDTVILDPLGESAGNVTLTREGTTNIWKGTFDDFSISGVYEFKMSALDAAGNAGTITDTVRFHAIDRTAPVISVPATVVRGSPLNVIVTENDKGLASISYRIDGGAVTSVAVTGTPPALNQTVAVPTGTLSLGAHTITFDVSDANDPPNAATYTESFQVTDGTGTAPPPATSKPVVRAVRSFAAFDGTLPVAVQSTGAITALTVAFDDGAPVPLTSWTSSSVPVDVSVAGLAAGAHTAKIIAVNSAGSTTQNVPFHVLAAGVPLPPGSIVVTKGEDGYPKITFVASPSDASTIGGYIIHRSASPFTVIAILDADAREYTDKTADRKKTYTYAVTAFGKGGEGRLEKGAQSETTFPWLSEVQSSSFTVQEPDSSFWTWFWVILILLVVIVAVVLLVVYREQVFRSRGGQTYDEEYPDDAAAGAAFGPQQHDLRCPNCTTEFSVTGEKPIVTTCPQCGKKGILR